MDGGDDADHIYGNAPAASGVADAGDSILGGAGHDYINGNAGNDTISGGDGNDRIQGGADNDLIAGDAGQDQINGNLGDDTVHGGDGNNLLQGGKGDDQVYGEAGSDTLMGNLGVNVLTGGAGADVVKFAFGDAVIVSGQTDRITDIQADDRIALDFSVPTQVLHGNGTSLASAATVAHDVLVATADLHAVDEVQIGADTYLFVDARADGHVEADRLGRIAAASRKKDRMESPSSFAAACTFSLAGAGSRWYRSTTSIRRRSSRQDCGGRCATIRANSAASNFISPTRS